MNNFAYATANSLRLKYCAQVIVSNVDKHVLEGEERVLVCNYVHVYYNERLNSQIALSEGSASSSEIVRFSLHPDDVLITKDSETPEDIAKACYVDNDVTETVCGYHLAILRPKSSQMLGRYLFWCLKSKPISSSFLSRLKA